MHASSDQTLFFHSSDIILDLLRAGCDLSHLALMCHGTNLVHAFQSNVNVCDDQNGIEMGHGM